MAFTQGQITIDESDTVDKRLQTLTRVEGGTGQTVHNEVFAIIDPDDGADDSFLRILAADPAAADRGMVVRDIGPASHARNDAFGHALAIGGELDDTAPVAATEGNVSPARITAQRALHANLRANDGTELATTANPLGVQIGDGTDTALVTGSNELSVLATAQPGVDIGDVSINGGTIAHDAAAASVNPVLIGGYVSANEPTEVTTDNDAIRAWFEGLGRQVVLIGHANPEAPLTVNLTALGDGTVIAAPGASTHLVIYKGNIINTSAANREVTLENGVSGAKGHRGMAGKNGGGYQFDFGSRGWELSSNTLLNADVEGSGAVDLNINITEYAIVAD